MTSHVLTTEIYDKDGKLISLPHAAQLAMAGGKVKLIEERIRPGRSYKKWERVQ